VQVVVAGASGFLGSHLVSELNDRGHTVTKLVRRPPEAADESRWHPAAGEVDQQVIEAADVVVNVAGSPTMGNPHSKKWATALRESRVTSTSTLADAIAGSGRKPAFLAGNGISIYGDHGAQPVTETSDSRGHAFLTEVSREWQAVTEPARIAGARVCVLRTAPVLDLRSEPLKALRRLFRLGLGGRLGSGEQYFPVISLRDWVAAVVFLAENHEARGPFNLCCLETPTNAEFTRALGRAVARPAVIPVPSFAIRAGAGRMAPELLGSLNTAPQALVDAGFEFHDPDVTSVLAAGLGQRS
jgi:uncharacterized protein (TIGR01777 family)